MKKCGQGATEYMIILAVCIIVALIFVGVTGGLPGHSRSSSIERFDVMNRSALFTLSASDMIRLCRDKYFPDFDVSYAELVYNHSTTSFKLLCYENKLKYDVVVAYVLR